MSVAIKNKQIVINGQPHIVMCGEIHYYRLARSDWQDRIDKLKASGCNAVASYIPWLCHEPQENEVDMDGNTRPELDLGAFIDLCAENGLYFIARPGPFIMAEMKNEGLPHWVYEKHPEIIPVGWDGQIAPTRTVDYLAPSFLQEVRRWFTAVMAVIAPRLQPSGGNIIAVQLDNEIGMLSWVSNTPDLTDHVLADFSDWLTRTYAPETVRARYPFALEDQAVRGERLRSPEESYAAAYRHDLGTYMRDRFARYVAVLRQYAEENGVRDVPFVINIHGTSDGRGFTYPIGISQLYEAYTQSADYLSGSDIYFGDLDMNTFQDLYIINGFMDAVHHPDQPLTSMEFNCGDGNFGSTFAGRYDPSAVDFKTRMCIAQGNRLINYYLFSGGYNYRFDHELNDGNDRIAFTGERHGFAAPVSPEGELNYTYPRMSRVIRTVMAVADKLAVMEEERDGLDFGFIPDYFMTEYQYPNSATMKTISENVQANRAHGAWEIMGRALLLNGYRFGSVDVQNKPIDRSRTKAIALGSARYMAAHVQQKLADYVRGGGGLLLYGEVPLYDMEGEPCTILADALGVRPYGHRRGSAHYYLSICADGWAAPRPEVRSHFAQLIDPGHAQPIMRVYDTGEVCAVDATVGAGRAIVIGTAYSCDLSLFETALATLGLTPSLRHDHAQHGIFMTSTRTPTGERFVHALNLDGFDKQLHVYDGDQPLFDGRKITLHRKDGVMFPINVTLDDVTIVSSTAEIYDVQPDALTFRLTQPEDVIVVKTDRHIQPHADYRVETAGDTIRIISQKHARVDDALTIYWAD